MAHRQMSSVIVKLNDLLLTANALLGNSGIMENAERTHGFRLREVPSDKFSALAGSSRVLRARLVGRRFRALNQASFMLPKQ